MELVETDTGTEGGFLNVQVIDRDIFIGKIRSMSFWQQLLQLNWQDISAVKPKSTVALDGGARHMSNVLWFN